MTRHRRRSTDRGLRILVRENWYRDVWLLIITGLCLVGLWLNHATLREQQKGRHFAVGVTCAAMSSISQAGRDVIAGAPQFEKALERLGFPPHAVGGARSKAAARLYVQNISLAVQRQVGGADHLIRPDGTINCRELQRLSNATATR